MDDDNPNTHKSLLGFYDVMSLALDLREIVCNDFAEAQGWFRQKKKKDEQENPIFEEFLKNLHRTVIPPP
jgi:hypothetical protein